MPSRHITESLIVNHGRVPSLSDGDPCCSISGHPFTYYVYTDMNLPPRVLWRLQSIPWIRSTIGCYHLNMQDVY
jgi:hypothetical protein